MTYAIKHPAIQDTIADVRTAWYDSWKIHPNTVNMSVKSDLNGLKYKISSQAPARRTGEVHSVPSDP